MPSYLVHCHAHRLALACTDTVKKLQHIQDCESGSVQTWKYFSRSPLKRAKLHEIQAADVDSSKRKLVKFCCTHWLSRGKAIKAMKAELSAVYTTLNYFGSTKKVCTAVGIIHLICTKHFLFSLYLLHTALEHLNKLSLLFQKGSFHFSHLQSAPAFCKKEIRNIVDSDQVINSLKLDWEKISKILPAIQKDLYEDDVKQIRCTTKTYCEALLQNLEDRFLEPQILFAFRIFDAKEIDANQRHLYGNQDLKLLIKRFKVASDEKILKVINDYQTLKDRMIMREFEFCLDAIAVAAKLFEIKFFRKYFPNCTYFVASSCPFHLQQPGQREDFPLCAVLKLNSVTGCLM